MVGEQRVVKEDGGAIFRHIHPHVGSRALCQPLTNRERIIKLDSIPNICRQVMNVESSTFRPGSLLHLLDLDNPKIAKVLACGFIEAIDQFAPFRRIRHPEHLEYGIV